MTSGAGPTCGTNRCGDEPCERCGAPASFFSTSVECDTDHATCRTTESQALCTACAKSEGVYPRWHLRLVSWAMWLVMLPLKPYLRRKYPREYWEARFKELEEKNSG